MKLPPKLKEASEEDFLIVSRHEYVIRLAHKLLKKYLKLDPSKVPVVTHVSPLDLKDRYILTYKVPFWLASHAERGVITPDFRLPRNPSKRRKAITWLNEGDPKANQYLLGYSLYKVERTPVIQLRQYPAQAFMYA